MARMRYSATMDANILAHVDWVAEELETTRSAAIELIIMEKLHMRADNEYDDFNLQILGSEDFERNYQAHCEAEHDEEMARRFGKRK